KRREVNDVVSFMPGSGPVASRQPRLEIGGRRQLSLQEGQRVAERHCEGTRGPDGIVRTVEREVLDVLAPPLRLRHGGHQKRAIRSLKAAQDAVDALPGCRAERAIGAE